MNTGILANDKENHDMVMKYRKANNSIEVFLTDEMVIKDLFSHSNSIRNTVMYGKYCGWCGDNNFFIKRKDDFYQAVLSNIEYVECKINGYDCFKNTSIKPEGLKEKDETF